MAFRVFKLNLTKSDIESERSRWCVKAIVWLVVWLSQTAIAPAKSPPKSSMETCVTSNRGSTIAVTSDPICDLASTPPNIDIDPQVIEESPVLQRWLEAVPDVASDIRHDPAFRTRARVGYAEFSNDETGGILLGVQDVFVGQTSLTVSADYASNGQGDRESFGIDAQYYLLPLGWYGNIAPVIGYRSIEIPDFDGEGVNIGFRIIAVPSRGGAADLSLTQSWVAPGTQDEVGLTTFSVGYAVTQNLRVATDVQLQNTPEGQESRVGILLEWMPR